MVLTVIVTINFITITVIFVTRVIIIKFDLKG